MGKASSAKKVARAARAGGSRRPGQRRALGFPLAIALIVVFGVGLVIYARSEREAQAAPRVAEDHWHAAYGIYLCDEWQTPLSDVGEDRLGIHTHDEGLVHIHPFVSGAAGAKAQLGVFFDQVSMDVTDKKISLPDGSGRTEGEDRCGKKGAIVQVARWASGDEAEDGKEPSEVIESDFDDIRFRRDGEAFTIAFAPRDAKLPPPPSTSGLHNVSDVEPTTQPQQPQLPPTSEQQ